MNFIKEETLEGAVWHHLGVLDGDMLKELLLNSTPAHWTDVYAKEFVDRFLVRLRQAGFAVMQGAGTNVLEKMAEVVWTHEQLKSLPDSRKD